MPSAGARWCFDGRMPKTEIMPFPLMSKGPRSSASNWAEIWPHMPSVTATVPGSDLSSMRAAIRKAAEQAIKAAQAELEKANEAVPPCPCC